MEKKTVSGIMLASLLVCILFAFNIQQVRASYGTIYIRADGSVDPPTAPIQRNGDLYTLTGNITSDSDGILVERSNITIDGRGYALQGTMADGSKGISLSSVNNVTIKEANIKDFYYGIYLYYSDSSSVSGNTVTNNWNGIGLGYSSGNSVSGNNITANDYNGIGLDFSSGNSVSGNNITNNGYGIWLSDSSGNNSVSGNNITANNGYGILLSDSSGNNSIYGNNVTNNGDDGIRLGFSCDSNSIYGNNITANTQYGIYLYYSNNCSVSGNNITAQGSEDGIYLYSSNSSSISGNNITNNWNGIVLDFSSSNNSVSGNTVTNNWNGIYLGYSSSSNSVSGNNITNNGHGIYLGYSSSSNSVSGNNITANDWDGIGLGYSSSNNSIYGNNITNNEYGIRLGFSSSGNSVSGNNITNNEYGIYLRSSNSSSIYGNTITANTQYGIYLYSSSAVFCGNNITNNGVGIWLNSSSSSSIYHNNFIGNMHQVEIIPGSLPNFWDDGYPSGGNYWSDIGGADLFSGPYQNETGSDGIGDSPHSIDGIGASYQDRYPLMNPWPSDLTPPITIHDYDGLWHTKDFTITLTATDYFSRVWETYYKINDGPTKTVTTDGQPHIETESNNNTLEYWSTDNADNEEDHHSLTEIKLDKAAPTGSITINGNDAYATSNTATLTLTTTDATSGINQVRYSNDDTWDTEPWETPSTTKTWTLTTQDGTKTVYAQFKDNAGLISPTYSDTIILDTAQPEISVTNPSPNSETKSSTLTIAWTSSDETSGIGHYQIRLDGGSWITVGTNTTHTFTGLIDGTHTIDVKASDHAGMSEQASVNFTVNTSPLFGPGYIEEAAISAIIVIIALGITIYFLKIRKKS